MTSVRFYMVSTGLRVSRYAEHLSHRLLYPTANKNAHIIIILTILKSNNNINNSGVILFYNCGYYHHHPHYY